MGQTGYCAGCESVVFLKEDGSCFNGHSAEVAAGIMPPPPEIPSGPDTSGRRINVILVAVVVGVLVLCGAIGGVSMLMNKPNNALGRDECFARQARVTDAVAMYLQVEAAPVPITDWHSAMAAIVPTYLAKPLACPSGGVYSLAPLKDGVVKVTCTTHGSYLDK